MGSPVSKVVTMSGLWERSRRRVFGNNGDESSRSRFAGEKKNND